MNKVVIFSILVLFAFAKSGAQEVNFGAKIGGNYATVNGDNSNLYDPVTAIIIGAMGELSLTEKFSIQPEIVFSRQGFSSETINLKVNYVNLPVVAKYYIYKGLSLEAGPQFGFRTLAIARTPIGEIDARDRVKTFDLGVTGGLGYKLESGLNFGARFNYGFSNINQYIGPKVNNQNAVIQAYVGLFFF